MSNNYFQFKQFRVEQGLCAMKVTTDACIQGAWTPVLPQVRRVLDVGAGTGLLSLMLAQRNPDIIIDAIELDKAAAAQARENVNASQWKDRINILEGDASNYCFEHKYGLIISNPPFFVDSLLSSDVNKNMARHTLSLTYESLLTILDRNMEEGGCVSILLPFTEYQEWERLMEQNEWFESGKLSVSHRPGAQVKRVVGLFSGERTKKISDTHLIIRDDEQNYTEAFTGLLSPFYLDL